MFIAVVPEQVEVPQGLLAGYSEQVLNPSQTPVVLHEAGSIFRHSGWPLPAGVGEQLPSSPVWLHDRHAPPHAVLQHTPSAQWPEAHSPGPVWQEAPFIFRPQLPFKHLRPATQFASVTHAGKHLLVDVSHEYGAHTTEAASLQPPTPSHR